MFGVQTQNQKNMELTYYPVTISGYNPNIFKEKEIECQSETSVISYLKQIFMNDLVIDILMRLNN